MAVCARTIQQADGSLLLALDPSATNLTACQYVVESGAETQWAFLTIEEATIFAGAIGLLWAVAWGFRQLVHALNVSEGSNNHD